MKMNDVQTCVLAPSGHWVRVHRGKTGEDRSCHHRNPAGDGEGREGTTESEGGLPGFGDSMNTG